MPGYRSRSNTFAYRRILSALAGLAIHGAYPVLQVHFTALRHICCIIVCVLAATQLSSDKTETVCRVSPKTTQHPLWMATMQKPLDS
jgi:hypothetical protein